MIKKFNSTNELPFRRIVAFLLDFLFLIVLNFLLKEFVHIAIVTLIYYIISLTSKAKATPGMRLFKLQVITSDQERMTALGAFVRTALIPLSFATMFGAIMIFWYDKKRALHDVICDTEVVFSKDP